MKQTEIDHPALPLAEARDLRARVRKAALEQLREEGLDASGAVADPGGLFGVFLCVSSDCRWTFVVFGLNEQEPCFPHGMCSIVLRF